jgi:hypothetical protein
MNPTTLSNPNAASKKLGVAVVRNCAILLKLYAYSMTSRCPPFLDSGTFKKSLGNKPSANGEALLCSPCPHHNCANSELISSNSFNVSLLGIFRSISITLSPTPMGGCKVWATGLQDILDEYALHKVHVFNGCVDPQHNLQLIAKA